MVGLEGTSTTIKILKFFFLVLSRLKILLYIDDICQIVQNYILITVLCQIPLN